MKITKEGIYKDKNGKEHLVFNVGIMGINWFRAYSFGAYYNVNTDENGDVEWEMTGFVRDFLDKDNLTF